MWEGRHGLKPVLYPPHIWMAFVFYHAKDTQLWDGGHWLKPVLHPSHRQVPPLQIQGRHNGHGPPPMLQLCLLPVLLVFLIMGRVLLLMGAGCSCSVRGCVRCRYWWEFFTPGPPRVEHPPRLFSLLLASFTRSLSLEPYAT